MVVLQSTLINEHARRSEQPQPARSPATRSTGLRKQLDRERATIRPASVRVRPSMKHAVAACGMGYVCPCAGGRRPRSPRRSALIPLVLLATAVSCSDGAPSAPTRTPATPSRVVTDYLDELLNVMQANSIRRREIDWPALRQRVAERVSSLGAQTIAEAGPAILLALELLGDNHSSYMSASGTTLSNPAFANCTQSGGLTPSLPADVGYVRVNSISGAGAAAVAYAQAMHTAIRERDRDDLAGWIVDLRLNGGGNMFPMLAGIGPILGEGTAGYFFDHERGFFLEFGYRYGAALAGATAVTEVVPPYELLRPGPRVAVITSRRTASSGEAIAVAFRGRPNTRFFGSPTCGVPTSNQGFRLSDGGVLLLTTALDADRMRRIYNEPLVPDEITSDEESAPRAVAWIYSARP